VSAIQPADSTTESGVRYYFVDREQQSEAVNQGMWIFLFQEIMFFSGLFMAYLLYRSWFPEAFAAGSHHLDVRLGALNTAVLLLSSFTMATAVRCTQVGKRGGTVLSLLLTAGLGLVFVGVKAVEYSHKWHEHLVPGAQFEWHGDEVVSQVEMFYNIYFATTGLHALHMIVGVGLVFALVPRAIRGVFNHGHNDPVLVTGLYWHFVDLVWIFLFPLLYLLGRH
jgi:cytochrome c oxidase subunit 3